jgi:hypothetical protein
MVACVHRLLDSDKLFPSGHRRLWPLWSGCHGDFKAAACWTTKRIWVLHDIFFFEAKVLHDLYKNGIRIETVSIGGSFFIFTDGFTNRRCGRPVKVVSFVYWRKPQNCQCKSFILDVFSSTQNKCPYDIRTSQTFFSLTSF